MKRSRYSLVSMPEMMCEEWYAHGRIDPRCGPAPTWPLVFLRLTEPFEYRGRYLVIVVNFWHAVLGGSKQDSTNAFPSSARFVPRSISGNTLACSDQVPPELLCHFRLVFFVTLYGAFTLA